MAREIVQCEVFWKMGVQARGPHSRFPSTEWLLPRLDTLQAAEEYAKTEHGFEPVFDKFTGKTKLRRYVDGAEEYAVFHRGLEEIKNGSK